MKVLFRLLSVSIFILVLVAIKYSYALTWQESTNSDFSDGIFNYSTSTAASPPLKIKNLTNWYDVDSSTWINRKPYVLTSASNLTDFQVQLQINTQGYISATSMRDDGADIRFTDEDGITPLSYWIETSTDQLSGTTNASIWIKVPSLTANVPKTIYFYYNNPTTSTSTSDRYAVDDLFEDWESGTIDLSKWTLTGDEDFQITTSSAYEGGYSVRSGPITHDQESFIEKTINLSMAGRVYFAWACSSENVQDRDRLEFYINGGTEESEIIGETSWSFTSFAMPSGVVTIQWRFAKNSWDSYGLDRAWIDYIYVRKSGTQPTIDDTALEEEFDQDYYPIGTYYSNVYNSGAANTIIHKATWTYFQPTGTSIDIYLRYSNTSFSEQDVTPSWQGPILIDTIYDYQGQYFQYRTDLNADSAGTTGPIINSFTTEFDIPPNRPSEFRGTRISSTVIHWEWEDNSGNELGFRLYSSTQAYNSTGFLSSSTVTGLLAQLNAGDTYYTENYLSPNTLYSRYVVSYSTAGSNVATRESDGTVDTVDVATLAMEPEIESQYFYWTNQSLDQFDYADINSQEFTTNSTFYFTSNIWSTGPTTVEYYRTVWSTNSTHIWDNTETLWLPATNFVYNDQTSNTLEAKPQESRWSSFNSDLWYMHIRSYNMQDIPSGITTLGPYYFNGCPSQITDLVAASNTEQEGAVNLTWTAPTANSTFTHVTNGQYIIKWSSFVITDDNGFNNVAFGGITKTTSTTAGLTESLLITGLVPGNTYWFAIKTVDSDNNYSSVSTNVNDLLNTRAMAAKVAKIVFTSAQQTTYVGLPSSIITIECQDYSGNPLRLYTDNQVNLERNSVRSPYFSEILSPWSPTDSIYITAGQYSGQFYYRDTTSGNNTIGAVNADSSLGWSAGTQTVTVLPGKAVTFEHDVNSSWELGQHALVTVRANDGYNATNTSDDYEGSVITTVTLRNSIISPATHLFTLSDSGQKVFDWYNNTYAGQGEFVTTEQIAQDFNHIVFADNSTGLLCASEGIVKKTGDSGSSWFALKYSVGSANVLNAITVDSSGLNVISASTSGNVIVSTNAMQTYSTVDTGAGQDLYGAYSIDISTVYVCGDNGTIVKSTCSGTTWSANIGPGGETNRFNSVYFVNTSTGFVCGNGGVAYKTVDGGSNWSSLTTGVAENLIEITFIDADNGFICGNNGTVLNTTNGGSTWNDISPSGISYNLLGIDFINSSIGYVCGEDRILLRTADGGTNWTQPVTTSTVVLNDVSFVGTNPTIIITIGEDGTILRSNDSGSSWSAITMEGQSSTVNWNGLIVTSTSTLTEIKQGRADQSAVKIFTRTMFGGNSTINQFRVALNGGTAADSDITSVTLYRDRNNNGNFDTSNDAPSLGSAVFASGEAVITGFSNLVVDEATYFMVLDIPITATIDNTIGFELEYSQAGNQCFSVQSGIKLAQNGLPYLLDPIRIVPSSTTLNIDVGNLSSQYSEVSQGQRNVLISSFSMITQRSNTDWSRLVVLRSGINNNDSSIESINLWESPTLDWNDRNQVPISSATFGAIVSGSAYLDISGQTINDSTTKYYFLSVDISPTAVPYTNTTDARFWLSFGLTTSYFLLDAEGANGIYSSSPSFTSSQLRIGAAYDTLAFESNDPPVGIVLSQSETKSFAPIRFYLTEAGGRADITRIRVLQTANAADSDIDSIGFYRDVNGDNTLQTDTDLLLGSAQPSSGIADILLDFPETITNTLSDFTTYFISASVAKRATIGNNIELFISSQNITLAGTDIASGSDITSPVASINNYLDVVNVTFEDLTPKDERVGETDVPIIKATMWAFCSASFSRISPEFTGTGSYSDVSLIKVYRDTDDDGEFLSSVDTLLGSGTFGTDGKSDITFSAPPTVYDSSYTVFVVYDLNAAATPSRTAGFGIPDTSFEFPGELGSNNTFGYYQSSVLTLLAIETPDIPALTLNVGWPSGKTVGDDTVYFHNTPSEIEFSWQSAALNGIAQANYALASYAVYSTTETPDVSPTWYSSTITTTTFLDLNLTHGTTYYLWVKAISTDGYERVTSVPIVVDLTAPTTPGIPTDTSPKLTSASPVKRASTLSSSYWINWDESTDAESGVLYYEIQERTNTSPVWVTISTSSVNQYRVTKDTMTDTGKFFYYRIRALNYAGSYSDYAESDSPAYLTLPPEMVKDLATYPNPFDSRQRSANITFILNQSADVSFIIYDLFGGKVKQWDYSGSLGENRITWDGTDEFGNKVAAGMYIMCVEVKTSSQTEKKRWKIGVIH